MWRHDDSKDAVKLKISKIETTAFSLSLYTNTHTKLIKSVHISCSPVVSSVCCSFLILIFCLFPSKTVKLQAVSTLFHVGSGWVWPSQTGRLTYTLPWFAVTVFFSVMSIGGTSCSCRALQCALYHHFITISDSNILISQGMFLLLKWTNVGVVGWKPRDLRAV